METDANLIPHLAQLSRLDLNPGEQQQLIERVPKILTYVSQLQKTITEVMPPPRDDSARLRRDEASPSRVAEAILAQAPDHLDRFWRVSGVFS